MDRIVFNSFSMEIVKIDQLSAAARSGALDGSLAFNTSYLEHRELIAQTAMSGLQGLAETLSETGIYARAVKALQQLPDRLEAADIEAHKDPFGRATQSQINGVYNILHGSQQTQAGGLNNSYALPARERAANAALVSSAFGTGASQSEIAAATQVKSAADAVVYAHERFADGDKSQVDSAYQKALAARNSALDALNQVPAGASQARRNAAAEAYAAAEQTLAAAQKLVDLKNSLMGQITGTTPTSSDLGYGYVLSTWGDTGVTTITDESGQGILIGQDGSVDSFDGSGKGWKIDSTTTLVLPGETKLTFTPGNPADMVVTRGIHIFTVENLRSGRLPDLSSYDADNGRSRDRLANDGHIVQMNGDAAHWTLSGSALGDESNREVMGQTPLENELKLDPTDVSLDSTPELKDIITQLALPDMDYDGDGKLNNDELRIAGAAIVRLVEDLQKAYEAALARLAEANKALAELNQLLELLRKQNDKDLQGQADESASIKAELSSVETRLLNALLALQNSGGLQTPAQGNIEGQAKNVLQQLGGITHQGGLQSSATTNTTITTPPLGNGSVIQNPSGEQGNSGNPNVPDPLGDSLRRAGRLLSGFSGGANLNILELPPSSTVPEDGRGPTSSITGDSTNTTGPTNSVSLEELAASFGNLVSQLSLLSPTSSVDPTQMTTANLSAGLDGLLMALDRLGILDISGLSQSTSSEQLLQGLAQLLKSSLDGSTAGEMSRLSNTSNFAVGNGSVSVASLLSFLGTLAQFGSELRAIAPQVGLTTPGQVEQAGVGSLQILSRTAEQVADVLAGQAELGSAGYSQGSGSPTGNAGTLANLSRAAEQLALVLKGMAELGSAGAGQSTNTESSRLPGPSDVRLGLQSLLQALGTFGVFNSSANSPSTSGNSENGPTTGISFGRDSRDAINTISSNFYTDPEQQKILEENLKKALKIQEQQMHEAALLFSQSQEIVSQFISLVEQDDLVQEVINSDSLSDEQQQDFDQRMEKLKKDLGVEWGSTTESENTPEGQSRLVSRAVQSGMMV